jgi:hypothetical protein
MAYENYTIRQFERAWFNGDRSVMTNEQFEIVKTEYVDTAGLFASEEFDKVGYISFLNNRVNTITLWIRLQREFINNFDIPYIKNFNWIKKFGHNIYWDKDVEKFKQELIKIEKKEKKYFNLLENAIKELIDFRAKKNSREKVTSEPSRSAFIRTVNSLGKIGWSIDKDKTTVEELAYIIKQQSEENTKTQ